MKLKILSVAIMLVIVVSTFAVSAKVECETFVKNSNIEYKWEQINEDGFGNRNNYATRGIETFQNNLIIGTGNVKNFPPNYSLHELIRAKFSPNDDINIIDELYKMESNGCEIWCYNGTSLRQIVGGNETAKMDSGFGNKNNSECGFLIEFKGYLYAGLLNPKEGGQIWRTQDINEEWEIVVENGFGNLNNWAAWTAEIFNDSLYVGTMNWEEGCEIFRTNDGENWGAVVGGGSKTENGFGNYFTTNYYAWSMRAYKSCLYVSTVASTHDLWKSKDGINWELVSLPKFPPHFTQHIRRMIVYNGELYLGMTGPGGAAYSKITIKTKLFSFSIPRLFLPFPIPAQIWKYNETMDKWTRVVGGIGRTSNSAGFGHPRNIRIWSMAVFNDQLYAGTAKAERSNIIIKRNHLLNWTVSMEQKGQGEIWRYNENNWEQINNPGFEDEYNVGIRSMEAYNNSLIVGTINTNTGCELWKYSPVET